MIEQPLWKNLNTLVVLDKQIEEVKKEIKQIESIILRDLNSIPKLESLVEELRQTYLNNKKNVATLELTAEEFKNKETKQRQVLEQVTNPKEQKAAEKELKSIVQKYLEQDDLLIKAWHQLEESEKKYNQYKEENANKIIQLNEGVQAQQGTLTDIQAKLNSFLEERKNAAKNIPAEWLDKYESMQRKVSDPIVPIVGSSCSVCYYNVLHQDLIKIKKGGVLPCKSCYRFLYYNAQEEENAKKETF